MARNLHLLLVNARIKGIGTFVMIEIARECWRSEELPSEYDVAIQIVSFDTLQHKSTIPSSIYVSGVMESIG